MAKAFTEITFTPGVREIQSRYGSRELNQRFEESPDRGNSLDPVAQDFISRRDSFYLATVSETGWPYVQHRGGPAGFLKVLDERTLGFADFRGNRQYLSAGNIDAGERVSLFLMDYPNRTRLKIWGRARLVHHDDAPELLEALEDITYNARVERGVVIHVEAVDWNCPQHITPRYTQHEIDTLPGPLMKEDGQAGAHDAAGDSPGQHIGEVPLARAAPGANDGSLQLTLARSGKVIAVPPEQTVLEAMLTAGIDAPYSCQSGDCGTCALTVLAGEPEHRDGVLSDDEKINRRLMCPCVSWARGDALTLDI